ncbi:serine/threonine protein kinase [Spirulina subsalsa FACHB-351]|uniref:non-specific serine/threonine protein kinase n=1 Tax=Spirulina subsalsa FACHB-351 TaxID=234711 RepID=A0ABT3L3R4_9CYAN|nr:serine/threonine-protein kinase [Spirulina subsalsa]MCW6036141.1 serine/threonine protein kinase [Spirulina subsalsa FACHB-351]
MNSKTYHSPVGQLLNRRYEIVQVLSSGAFGQTYIAQDITQPGRPRCVVKYYQSNRDYPNLLKTSRRIFVSEVETLKKLGNHDQIPQFFDCFEENQGFYLVQELIIGQTLSTELSFARYGEPTAKKEQVVYLLRDLLTVLDYVHRQGVIHCDVKPNNIIRRIEDGRLILIDFGAAQPVRSPAYDKKIIHPLSLKTTVAVSPSGYLATEQLLGTPYPCSDIYALGIIAIQFLTGLDPAKLQLNLETSEINWQEHYRQNSAPEDYSEELAAILSQMVRYNYRERYASAQAVLDALKPLLVEAKAITLEASSRALEEAFDRVSEECTQDIISLFPVPGSDRLEQEAEQANFEDWSEEKELFKPQEQPIVSSMGGLSQAPSLPSTPPRRKTQPTQAKAKGKSSSGQLHPSMMKMLTRMGVLVAVLNAFAIALGIYTLVDSRASEPAERLIEAEQALHAGKLEDAIAIAQSIPADSPAYEESQAFIQQWQKEWKQASRYASETEQAFQAQQWQEVLSVAAKVPPIDYWRNRVSPLVKKARTQAETEAQDLLNQAFTAAINKDFSQAIEKLQRISPQTSIGQTIQPKLEEYRRKQNIRAMWMLQQAYNLAAEQEFQRAITFLEQIPADTPAGAIAKEKLPEYQQKQRIIERLGRRMSYHPSEEATFVSTLPSFSTLSDLNPGAQLQEVG